MIVSPMVIEDIGIEHEMVTTDTRDEMLRTMLDVACAVDLRDFAEAGGLEGVHA